MMPQPGPAHQPAEPHRPQALRTITLLAAATLFAGGSVVASAYRRGRAAGRREHAELRRQLAELAEQQHLDALTHLPTRAPLLRELDAWARRASRTAPFYALFVDLDDFKPINDTHGHGVGDAVLVTVANRLADSARTHNGLAFRLSGDEFVMLLPATDGPDGPLQPVWDLRERLCEPIVVTGMWLHVASSIGLVRVAEPLAAKEILRRADSALYRAKDSRGCVKTYEPTLDNAPTVDRPVVRRRDRRQTSPDVAGTARHIRSAA